MRHECFHDGMKAGWHEGGGRVLLGDNTGGGRSCCCWSGSGVLEFRFQLDFFVYTYIVSHMYASFRLAQNSTCAKRNYCVIRGVFVDTEESGTVLLRAGSTSTVFVTGG